MPLLIDLPGLSFTRAYFEAMSGLSTTGATMLSGLDQLPHSVNLWRHALSWLGGMGIIVLAIAILPLLGVGGMQLYRAGAPGTVKDAKLAPRITETAQRARVRVRRLDAACALGAVGWRACRPFDAICHAFSTLSLGGFSTHDANIALLPFTDDRIGADAVHADRRHELRHALHRAAQGRLPGSTSAIRKRAGCCCCCSRAASLIAVFLDLQARVRQQFRCALRFAAFNVISFGTGGGFVSTNYGSWPVFAPMWMLFLSCLCASTGSTGGGIKMFRSLILIKQSLREMFTLVHPAGGGAAEDLGPGGAERRGLLGAGVPVPVLHDHRGADLRAADLGPGLHVRLQRDRRLHQ